MQGRKEGREGGGRGEREGGGKRKKEEEERSVQKTLFIKVFF